MTDEADGRDERRNAALAELEQVYQDLAREVDAAAVRCDLSGVCCDFERSGHVLFATELEVEYARRHGASVVPEAPAVACPFFVDRRCELRNGRPLGCRVYFCDPNYAEKMHELAERHHRRVAEIHERHRIGYRYDRFIDRIRRPSEA